MKHFTVILLSTLAISLFSSAGLNLLVDPYGLFGIAVGSLNSSKPFQANMEQQFKPIQLYRVQPNFIIVGSSVSQFAFDPRIVSPKGFNFGIDGPTIYEVGTFLRFGIRNAPVRRALVALEFMMFNGARGLNNSRYNPERMEMDLSKGKRGYFSAPEWFRAIFSNETLTDSIKTVLSQTEMPYYDDLGFIPKQAIDHPSEANYPSAFAASIKAYLGMHKNTHPSYTQVDDKTDLWNSFRDLLQNAYNNEVELVILISPTHNLFREALVQAGLGPKFDEWRKDVPQVIQQVAKTNNRHPFPFYDYSDDSRNLEKVPKDRGQSMKYWNDAYHCSHYYGEAILREIFKSH